MAAFLLCSWLVKAPAFARQQADVVELFAGKARVARLATTAGWACLAHDVAFDPGNNGGSSTTLDKLKGYRSCMDLNGNAGFA